MPTSRVWLIDVYDTTVTVDFAAVNAAHATFLGLESAQFTEQLHELMDALSVGELTIAEVGGILASRQGIEPSPELLTQLTEVDRELMRQHSAVHDDMRQLLSHLREAGARVAFVSNCADGTRDLLIHHGLDQLATELVLSNEVGIAKPDAGIYEYALQRLGATAEDAVFIDDRHDYCQGALALGIESFRLLRAASPVDHNPEPARLDERTSPSSRPGPTSITSALEALAAVRPTAR